jgi:hypothetical protein
MAPVDGGENNFVMTPTGAVPLDRMNLYFQLPQQNTDKIPPVTKDPPSGEPTGRNSNTANITSAISRDMAKSLTVGEAALNIRNALTVLQSASGKPHVSVAYSYLTDAAEIEDVADACSSLRKALTTDDPFLFEGYIGRAMQSLQDYYHLGVDDDA